ncbi:flagellar basal body protein [Sulfitobacter sp. M57]|uniref:flagellar hook-basal body complex protein FliE n=1 Tax=unclassified Sulfitobacter TaxID=196795 RepID=UPI0023E2EF47|nr:MULTISPECIES: flagellar hook-basal body complex protein FliE [unclassified Sulfitobacter]MDF3414822.1 flagellar basal body protein [Sulfitobacter sp. KE5]MDF3422303.1 flagellar basal body protein [Sulfitobacter sp. KE43]MDF3433368.1 flagellar basal body protein [Sulfitobacter sp. KE42]MDF3459008.1 flagellar basal body protein [Sulfitobacter sp. S74]MDF3462907.1 flagellar basal body protein [Sulfitobacter sp. Ks18]
MSDFASVRSSYVQAAYTKSADTKLKTSGTHPAAADFSTMVSNAAAQAVETVRTGDRMAIAGLNGQAGLQQVVEATMAMESTIQVSVALRDKLVEAYQDIMRMPI